MATRKKQIAKRGLIRFTADIITTPPLAFRCLKPIVIPTHESAREVCELSIEFDLCDLLESLSERRYPVDDILELLKEDLAFVEQGGYWALVRTPWLPKSAFRTP